MLPSFWKWVPQGERKGGRKPGASIPFPPDPERHLGAEVVLLQLAALPQVPAAHSVVQAPRPEPSAIIGDVDAAGTVRVALELPGGRRAGASVLELGLLQHPPRPRARLPPPTLKGRAQGRPEVTGPPPPT